MKKLQISFLMMLGLLLVNPAHSKDDRNLAVSQTNNAISEKRIALVIGNSAYTNSPLKNPVNDAKDVAAKLRKLGFEVVERHNLTTKQIGRTLSEFRSKLVPGGVALVFYAGHGLQIKGENYLPAVDAEISAEEDVANQSLAVRQIMDVLDDSKTRLNLVFLDACRNNPYSRSFRSAAGDGLARITAPSGTLISYATRPGSVAEDGIGHNGLYTSKLLAQMDSNLQIELALKQVVTAVKAASQGKQEPWMEGSIEGDFCFAGCITSVGNQDAIVPSQLPVQIAIQTPSKIAIRSVLTYHNGRYEGDVVDNKRNGKGVYTSSNGDRYEGEWANDQQTGKGTFTWSNGDRYDGDFASGRRNGKGTMTWGKGQWEGERYEGDWANDQQTGKGTFTWPNGERYEGDWINGQQTGKGIKSWSSGDRYEGDIVNGKIIGKGIFTSARGSRYVGEFVNDFFTNGVELDSNGRVVATIVNGKKQ